MRISSAGGWIALLLLVVAVMSACSPATGGATPVDQPTDAPAEDDEPVEAQPTESAPNEGAPDPTSDVDDTPTDAPSTDDPVDQAVANLAGRLAISADAIEVVSVESVTWTDGSLGCPEPDKVYTQALVEGMLIRLLVDNTVYNYHRGTDGSPFLCNQIQVEETDIVADPIDNEPADPPSNPFIETARSDLAERLSVPDESIEVVSFEAVIWPDGSLGCPQPGIEYPQVQVEGSRIVLRANGQLYTYHSGGRRGPFLCETAAKPPDGVPPDELLPPPGFDE